MVISKCDLLDEARLESLRAAIAARFPGKEILAVSPREGIDLEAWFAKIASEEQAAGKAMEVDYTVYADGEALLGWLNCTVQLAAAEAFDGDNFLRSWRARCSSACERRSGGGAPEDDAEPGGGPGGQS